MAARRSEILILCAGLLAWNAGCGGNAGPRAPATELVSGTVTYKGTPLAGATVTFHPQSKTGRTAVAQTTDSGSFRLTTVRNNDGAITGDYRVTVSKAIDENASAASATFDMAAPAKPAQFKSVIPEKYGKPGSSGLTASVKPGPNTVELTLTEK